MDKDPAKFSVDFNRGWVTRYVAGTLDVGARWHHRHCSNSTTSVDAPFPLIDTNLQLLQRSDIQPVTVVVARRIKPELGHVYQDWVVGVAAASESFAGNLGTSLILPGEGDNRWVLLYRC